VTRNQFLFGIVAVALIGLGVAAWLVFRGGSDSNITDIPRYTVSVDARDHALGSPNAPVQFVEYGAPTCPVCSNWFTTVFPSFKQSYVDTGKVLYVFRVFPLQPVDLAVEAMGRCLPHEKYFPFIDMMWRNQSKWDPDGYQIPDIHAALVLMGGEAGMPEAQVNKCTSDRGVLQAVSAAGQKAGTTYNINSTPSFLIDGAFHQQDVMTYEGLEAVLNAEIARKAGSS